VVTVKTMSVFPRVAGLDDSHMLYNANLIDRPVKRD
jgi:hypothetical protein